MAAISAQLTILEELCTWASRLRLDDVPDRVVAYASSQVLSQLGSVRAGMSHPIGPRLQQAMGSPLQSDPARASCVLAALTSCLHFDDAAYAGHLSSSAVSVPISYARVLGLTGPELLTAVIAANECAARVTATATLGPFRGQTAAHTHLVGAVSGRLRCAGAPARQWTAALSLALAAPPWTLLHPFLSSDAKVLSAATPIRTGLDACDAAAAGLSGPADILEHTNGFLARFATVPLPAALTQGLGERWHTETLSFKMHPGAPTLDAAVDCALDLYRSLGPLHTDDVEEIVITTSMYSILLEQAAFAYTDGPRTPTSALVFSTPYAVATALLTGALTASDYAAPATQERARWQLAGKVRVAQDVEMTRASVMCEVPFGEALRQAGTRAEPWLRDVGTQWLVDLVGEVGPPSESFETAQKITPARVMVRLRDGRCVQREHMIPVGSPGSVTRGSHAELVRAKFLATGGNKQTADIALALRLATAADVDEMLQSALTLPPGINDPVQYS